MAHPLDQNAPTADQACLQSLHGAVGDATRVLILPHNDPDPDAIASAMALKSVIQSFTSAQVVIAYGGILGRAENRALAHYLKLELERVNKVDWASFGCIALVDTQPGAGNNVLPETRAADIVIDHHQPFREQTAQAKHIDVRLDVGATSTILTGYVLAAGLEISPRLATALFYGIQTDTLGLGRKASAADKAAYMRLQGLVEVDQLVNIQRAQVPREYFYAFAETLRTAEVYGSAIIAHLGDMYRPDMAAEMADVLLRLEGIRWVMCSGFHKDMLYLSFRSTRVHPGAGQLAQAVVRELGMAGGHGMAGGGQVTVKGRDREAVLAEVRRRFLLALNLHEEQAEPLIGDRVS